MVITLDNRYSKKKKHWALASRGPFRCMHLSRCFLLISIQGRKRSFGLFAQTWLIFLESRPLYGRSFSVAELIHGMNVRITAYVFRTSWKAILLRLKASVSIGVCKYMERLGRNRPDQKLCIIYIRNTQAILIINDGFCQEIVVIKKKWGKLGYLRKLTERFKRATKLAS